MVEAMHLTPIGSGKVLLEPEFGLDPGQPGRYLDPLIGRLQDVGATRLLYDLKKIPVIDSLYYHWLISLHDACKICGIELIAVRITPAAAYGLAFTLEAMPPFRCVLDVDAVD
jgi:hypothetical protein